NPDLQCALPRTCSGLLNQRAPHLIFRDIVQLLDEDLAHEFPPEAGIRAFCESFRQRGQVLSLHPAKIDIASGVNRLDRFIDQYEIGLDRQAIEQARIDCKGQLSDDISLYLALGDHRYTDEPRLHSGETVKQANITGLGERSGFPRDRGKSGSQGDGTDPEPDSHEFDHSWLLPFADGIS